ncbi:hypothetical protein N7536_007534 [Penicillium majusculum]|nr:hypothetical protein N7536_007534 [Penicillium majusculum]
MIPVGSIFWWALHSINFQVSKFHRNIILNGKNPNDRASEIVIRHDGSVNCRQAMPVCFVHPKEGLQRSLGVANFERDEILEFHNLCLPLQE